MKKSIKHIALLIIFVVIVNIINTKTVFADVGDFETYSGGSSSWSSSGTSWDYDYDYDSGGSSSIGIIPIFFGDTGAIIFVIVMMIVIAAAYKKGKYTKRKNPYNNPYRNPSKTINEETIPEETIANLVKAEDPLFNKEEFLSWARDLFIKLQYAWSDRDWSIIRCFESNELFEQHSTQLERYKVNKQINKIERVSVNWAKLFSYKVEGENEVLTILLNSKMIDYIIDEDSGKVLQGDKTTNRINTYKLTFMRKKGIKTKPGETTVNTTNCPNCGAPTEITSAGKCSYCGSIITTGEYNWVLSNLERI